MEYAVVYLQYYFLGMIPSMIHNMGKRYFAGQWGTPAPLVFSYGLHRGQHFPGHLVCGGVSLGASWGRRGHQLVPRSSARFSFWAVCEGIRALCHLSYKRSRFDPKMLLGDAGHWRTRRDADDFYNVTNVDGPGGHQLLGTTSAAAWSTFLADGRVLLAHLRRLGYRRHDLCGAKLWCKKAEAYPPKRQAGLVLHFGMSIVFEFYCICSTTPLSDCLPTISGAKQTGGRGVLSERRPIHFFPALEIFSSSIRGTGNAIKPTIITLFGCVSPLRIAFLLVVTFPHTTHLSIALCYPVTWIAMVRRLCPVLQAGQVDARARVNSL